MKRRVLVYRGHHRFKLARRDKHDTILSMAQAPAHLHLVPAGVTEGLLIQ